MDSYVPDKISNTVSTNLCEAIKMPTKCYYLFAVTLPAAFIPNQLYLSNKLAISSEISTGNSLTW